MSLFAHSWGWDEILYFLIPIVVVLGGIRWAEARARRRAEEHDEAEGGMGEPPAA